MNIAVDFDGVIHRYSKDWRDGTIYDPPMPGCREALEKLIEEGHEIIVYTTRIFCRDGRVDEGKLEELVNWMDAHEIPFDQVHTAAGKPIAHVYVDDRAVRFTNWKITWLFASLAIPLLDSSLIAADRLGRAGQTGKIGRD